MRGVIVNAVGVLLVSAVCCYAREVYHIVLVDALSVGLNVLVFTNNAKP